MTSHQGFWVPVGHIYGKLFGWYITCYITKMMVYNLLYNQNMVYNTISYNRLDFSLKNVI